MKFPWIFENRAEIGITISFFLIASVGIFRSIQHFKKTSDFDDRQPKYKSGTGMIWGLARYCLTITTYFFVLGLKVTGVIPREYIGIAYGLFLVFGYFGLFFYGAYVETRTTGYLKARKLRTIHIA